MAGEITINKSLWIRFTDYVSDVRAEMRRVTWPGRQEVYGTTVMVIITTFLFGFYFMLCDGAFSRLVTFILNWGKSVH
ncbi:MAG: preprotein translocase subunit SecE [Acidobacteria bacterium]|nr:preprotein translocase subunit SecE [Acidobacteriota bacterium]